MDDFEWSFPFVENVLFEGIEDDLQLLADPQSLRASYLEAVRRFLDGGHISNEALVTLEIFEKQTFANLNDFPIATLHFTGTGPVYRSFQVNAVVEILTPEHPAYRFAFLSRRLFEYDRFHITQTHFPFAYLFHPVEVRDKTPYAKRPSS